MLLKKLKLISAFTIMMVTALIITGCSDDDAEELHSACPLVLSTIPADDAVNVPLDQIISVTFNEDLRPETVNTETFKINGDNTLEGSVSYSEKTGFFTPTVDLLPFTIYTGTVTTGVKDTLGNALQENHIWSFTTIPEVTLTVAPEATGTVSGAGVFDNGSTVSIVATPNAGFEFINWTVDGVEVSTNANYQFEMSGNIALVANFDVANFTLSIISENGTVSQVPNQQSFADGTEVILTPTPDEGYEFSSWSGDANGNNNPLTIT
ncbi:InlB B-repeat-containing protein, partial [Mesohalobacter salilacus]|uniref:InlB B-repeat-containing protein n=1 Tax=Mesohalobacter salilacus TaxID=2491711 RepID=UPI000F9E8812